MKHLKFLAVASFMAGLLSCTVEIPEVKVIEKASAENGCPTDKIKVLKTTKDPDGSVHYLLDACDKRVRYKHSGEIYYRENPESF